MSPQTKLHLAYLSLHHALNGEMTKAEQIRSQLHQSTFTMQHENTHSREAFERHNITFLNGDLS